MHRLLCSWCVLCVRSECTVLYLLILLPPCHSLLRENEPQISVATASTKLSELKNLLASDEYFGSKAPVKRQRLFYLGRELKSGGRSLCNLGLGKFNNRILHLYVRPSTNNENNEIVGKDKRAKEDGCKAAEARKRNRTTESQSSTQECRRQRYENVTNNNRNEERIEEGNGNSSSRSQPVAARSNYSMANNLTIDLVDSSDDDEVEIIEVL